jgi:O-methyltransferase involved in polyketide biosynthesis
MTTPHNKNISPTAYATGDLWYRHGLSHPALALPEGERLGRRFQLLIRAVRGLSGFSIETMLLARHRGIDAVLMQAIDEGRVRQVIEIAAGLSARGWRMKQKYGDRLTYIETDLPAMADTKRRLLQNANLLPKGHRVLELDALADDGPRSLSAIAATLDPALGTAVITEGLMSYLDPETAQGVWRRIARALKPFSHGLYLSDIYMKREHRNVGVLLFGAVISAFVRGRMHVHFETPAQAVATMQNSGFRTAFAHETSSLPQLKDLAGQRGAERVRILEARC